MLKTKLFAFKYISKLLNINKFLFLLMILSCNILISHAQLAEEDFKVFVTPNNPKIGETFLVFLDEYNVNVNKADISWLQDGKIVSKGFGKISQSFVMKDTPIKVEIILTLPGGKTYIKNKSFSPKSISLIYEGLNSFTPSWYEGKRFSTRGDTVRVTAVTSISDGKSLIKDSDLFFKWEMNSEIIKGGGLGANYVDIKIEDFDDSDNEVTVSVSPRLSGDTVTETTIIKTVSPEILIYKNSTNTINYQRNLVGLYNGSPGESIKLTAIPLFFNLSDNVNYAWSINNKTENTTQNIKTFKLGTSSGVVSVSVAIDSAVKLFQTAKSELLIRF